MILEHPLPPESTPRVSIIVRTKDRPLLLARALDDILGQTSGEWEAIIVNDGGAPDAVDELVASRAAAFGPRVAVVHHERSRGMEAASNHAVELAKGEFIAVHDDDDTWHPEFLATTIGHLDDHADSVAVAVRTEIIVERIDGETVTEIERRPFGPPHDVVTLLDLILINRVVPIGLLVRTSVLRGLGGYDATLPVVGDWEFNLRLAQTGQIDFLPDTPLAFWHQRPESAGILGNSVAANGAHAQYDRLVRDRALRADLADGGTGKLLYLAMLVDEVVQGAERRIVDQQRRAIAESEQRIIASMRETVALYSPIASLRRAVRRILRRPL